MLGKGRASAEFWLCPGYYVCGEPAKSIIPVTVILLSDELLLTFSIIYFNSSFKLVDEVMYDSLSKHIFLYSSSNLMKICPTSNL